MRTLKDLKLCKKSHAKVEAWLHEWLDMLIKNAQGQQGNVYRANFETMKFFFFTDCRDLVSKEVESASQEASKKIIVRKRYVMAQLLMKSLLGEVKLLKIKCTHCDCKEVWIDSFDGGYFKYCQKCGKTDISTFPNSLHTCSKDVGRKIAELRNPPVKSTPRFDEHYGQLCESCGEPLTLFAVENKLVCTNMECGHYGLEIKK